MPSGPGQVLPHLLKAYISSWTETGSLRDAVDCGSLSVFANNGGLTSVSSLYFWNSFERLLLLEVCSKVDASIPEIAVVGVLFSSFRARIVWYVVFCFL